MSTIAAPAILTSATLRKQVSRGVSSTPAEQLCAAAKIRRAVDLLLRTAPFYAELLTCWSARMDESCATCGVSWDGSRILLRWSPTFFSSNDLSVPQAAAVMQHEAHHVLFGHVFWKPDASTDLRARLIAAETVANEFISPQFPLPGRPIRYEDFTGLGLAPLQSTLVRYDLLKTADVSSRLPDLKENPFDDHGGWESISSAGTVAKLAIAAATQQALKKVGRASDPSTARLMQALADEGSSTTSRGGDAAGAEAGTGVERVRSTKTAWLNWPAVLAHLPPGPEVIEESWSRPPRRRPELVGFVPGRQRVSQPPTLLVAIDVSASMSSEILGWIKHEVRALAAFCRVAVCEIDESLQRAQLLYDDMARMPEALDDDAHGRGGTAFDAAFRPELLAWAGGGESLSGVIYFTDGFGPEPTRTPHIPVVWVLSDEHERVRIPAEWGMVIAPDGTIQRPLVGARGAGADGR